MGFQNRPAPPAPKPWVLREYVNCSGCRLCEIACTQKHEGRIWPEASMVRVFMLVPGLEVPHLCAQCSNYPCVNSCPFKALSVNEQTGAVAVDKEKCTACSICIRACPGTIPHLHPNKKYIVICDLCDGDPECAKVCTQAGYNCLQKGTRTSSKSYDLYAKKPEDITANLAVLQYAEKGEELTK